METASSGEPARQRATPRPRRNASRSVERPGASALVALPDRAANGSGDGLAGAIAAWWRRLRGDEREGWRGLLRLGPRFHWSRQSPSLRLSVD